MRHEGQHLVVIHDSVEGLDPLWINITIEDDPLIFVLWLVRAIVLVHVSHDDRQDTIFPFLRFRVHATEQLIGGNSLWIYDIKDSILVTKFGGLSESLPDSCLSRSWVTNNEDTMPNINNLLKLHNLENE